MPTVKSFDNYQLFVCSQQFNEWQANILLKQPGGTVVVDVRFVTNPASFPGTIAPTGVSTIYCGLDRYPWFIDVLRNEKPLSAALYPAVGSTPIRMLLQTGAEPIGEAEGV